LTRRALRHYDFVAEGRRLDPSEIPMIRGDADLKAHDMARREAVADVQAVS
jgi:hypothetical protein